MKFSWIFLSPFFIYILHIFFIDNQQYILYKNNSPISLNWISIVFHLNSSVSVNYFEEFPIIIFSIIIFSLVHFQFTTFSLHITSLLIFHSFFRDSDFPFPFNRNLVSFFHRFPFIVFSPFPHLSFLYRIYFHLLHCRAIFQSSCSRISVAISFCYRISFHTHHSQSFSYFTHFPDLPLYFPLLPIIDTI